MERRPICEDDLHAWADGRLDAARRAEVDAWLAEDPARAARLAGWRDDARLLHAAYDPVADQAIPARLRAVVENRRRGGAWRAAAVLGWLTLGALVGSVGGYQAGRETPVAAGLPELARQAALAHAVYSPEVRHPVEVGADQEQHLVAWLSKRLGAPVRVPNLAANGFALLGGRLLPASEGPGAQFMYEDDGGRRLTLYLSARAADSPTSAFRYAQADGIGVFYWVDERFAYALSGQVGRATLLPIATDVYHQLVP